MRRAALALVLFLLSATAGVAQTNCILSDPAWVTPYHVPPSTISSIGYQVNLGYMAAIYPNNTERAFEGVPNGVAQRLTQVPNPTTLFNSIIVPVYPEGILTSWASGPCPILAQTGKWILSGYGAPPPKTNYIVSDVSREILTSDNGIKLTAK